MFAHLQTYAQHLNTLASGSNALTNMVDHWVSKDRYYCKFCNVWMQSDKMVRCTVNLRSRTYMSCTVLFLTVSIWSP